MCEIVLVLVFKTIYLEFCTVLHVRASRPGYLAAGRTPSCQMMLNPPPQKKPLCYKRLGVAM